MGKVGGGGGGGGAHRTGFTFTSRLKLFPNDYVTIDGLAFKLKRTKDSPVKVFIHPLDISFKDR